MSELPNNLMPGGISYTYSSYLSSNDLKPSNAKQCDYYVVKFKTEDVYKEYKGRKSSGYTKRYLKIIL